jgi:phosphopantothenoylcysteine decarboxylase/phosphopantothenate--cysteine ligase
MGIAIAAAARDAGWDVTLLLGPVCAAPPEGVRVEHFNSTDDLVRLLDVHFATCNVLIMAAAVADYRPVRASSSKLSRGSGNLTLELTPTADLVKACAEKRKLHQRIVGFALEDPKQLDARALEKLRKKSLDAIVANPLETMGSERINAKVFTPDGSTHTPEQARTMDKSAFARWLVNWIEHEFPPQR